MTGGVKVACKSYLDKIVIYWRCVLKTISNNPISFMPATTHPYCIMCFRNLRINWSLFGLCGVNSHELVK